MSVLADAFVSTRAKLVLSEPGSHLAARLGYRGMATDGCSRRRFARPVTLAAGLESSSGGFGNGQLKTGLQLPKFGSG